MVRKMTDTTDDILDLFLSTAIGTLDAEKIYDALTDAVMKLFHPDGLLLMLNHQAAREFSVIRNFGSITCEKNYCVLCDALTSHLTHAEQFLLVAELPPFVFSVMTTRKQRWLKEQNISAIYTLKYHRGIIGFLFLSDPNGTYSEEQIQCLNHICYYAAYLLRNANLYQNAYRASITDNLTSLYNRKYAFECVENACIKQQPKSLILLDIDDFKLYNELYGSQQGDNLIHHCAHRIQKVIGENDLAFRYGADEFMVLHDGCDAVDASALAHTIINSFHDSETEDTVWDMTVTVGISVFPVISPDAKSLLRNAEQAVYYGKMDGKGKVIVYHKGLEHRSKDPNIRSSYERVAPTIYALTAAIDAKDAYTFIHSMNVSKYAVILAEAIGMNDYEIEVIREAGLLHDIGKISIPETILKKTSRLTEEEYNIMKTHVENSTKMIRYLPNMDYVIPAVVGHHERYDGMGYPRGLAGENIPFMARVLTVADCFDAMTARRPYKQPLSIAYAVGELKRNRGTQFDPVLSDKFVELIEEGKIAL